MDNLSVAPCGVICNLCSGYQRDKNKCVGCNNVGNKVNHCNTCRIKNCEEKNNKELLCNECIKFPCKIIKNLDKRYKTKYGESPINNLQIIKEKGIEIFIKMEKDNWKCKNYGKILCVHKKNYLECGETNPHYPIIK
ncbi:MAG: hypothetical protein LBB80_09385 [Treponema sp.]|nr:hypothetical protein [Treponema sp.]